MHLGGGLNVLVGIPEKDLAALRSAFGALTGTAETDLEVLVEVDGAAVPLDRVFARTHGLHGRRPPVLDVPQSPHPRSAPEQQLVEMLAHERSLISELELTRRELDRERDLVVSAMDDAPRAETDLHPADVAVMCDRLRELLTVPGAGELVDLLERLEEFNRDRVYVIFREEALGQLMVECDAAISSAREYLRMLAGTETRTDPETTRMEAHTIARIELLEEFAGFLEQQTEELGVGLSDAGDLLSEANGRLTEAGRRPASTLTQAVGEIRDLLSSPAVDDTATGELVTALAAWLGVRSGTGEDVYRDPHELLAAAEERLAAGGGTRWGDSRSGTWRRGDPERLAELEANDQRLASKLVMVRRELASLERGLEALERSVRDRPRPNPFEDAPDSREAGRPGGVSKRWSLSGELAAVRDVEGAPRLPVLLVEPPGGHHELSHLDPLAVAALAMGGQILWVTDREAVPETLGVLGDAVEVIRV